MGHATIQGAIIITGQQPFHGLSIFSATFFVRVDSDMQIADTEGLSARKQ